MLSSFFILDAQKSIFTDNGIQDEVVGLLESMEVPLPHSENLSDFQFDFEVFEVELKPRKQQLKATATAEFLSVAVVPEYIRTPTKMYRTLQLPPPEPLFIG